MKGLIDDIVITCDDIADMRETALIYSNDKTNCWLLCIVHSAVTCSLLLVVILVIYYMKRKSR